MAFMKSYPVMLGLLFLGIGYGVYMRSCGFNVWLPVFTAAIVFAGSMEFITATSLLTAFNPAYAFLLTLIVNGRHLFYGISILEKYRGMGKKKAVAVCGLIDEAFSINYMTDETPGADHSWFMALVSLFLYLSWVAGTTVGSFAACKAVTDIKGVNFVMTALFIVIFISQWQKETTHGSSMLGLAVAGICLYLFGGVYFMLPTIIMVSAIFTTRWCMTKDKEVLA